VIPARALPFAAALLLSCAPAEPPPARVGLATVARAAATASRIPAAAPAEAAAVPAEPPAFHGDVLTDARDVRACLPLEGGAVLAGTGGGLLLVREDGTVRAPWTSLDGLPETRVHALLRDGERIWIGTEGGLVAGRVRDDRLALERPLPSKPVRALAFHDGSVFAATWGGGVVRVEDGPSSHRLSAVQAMDRGSEARFDALAEHRGVLYAGGPAGLYRVTDREMTPVEAGPKQVFALAAHEDRLWIGSLTGLSSLGRGALRDESSADVRALAPAGDALLAATFGQGTIELRDGRSQSIGGAGALPFTAAAGASRGVRCAGGPGGLFVQRSADAPWRAAPIPALPSNDLSALARDGDRLWIGTFDRGLAVLQHGRVTPVRDAAIDEKINALAVERMPSGSRVWAATARGLALVEPREGGGARVIRYTDRDGLPASDVHAVTVLATGGALVGTARGAAIVEDGHITALTEKRGIAAGAVWAVAEGPDGTLLLGTSRGLLLGERDRRGVVFRGAPGGGAGAEARPWLHVAMATGDLADDWITALAVRDGTIYVGTYNAGVTMLTQREDKSFATKHLGGGYVNAGGLLVDRGTIFAATMSGLLARPADGSGDWKTASRAAPGKDVTALALAGDRLWVASRRGLSRVAKSSVP
jgi:hypothetical protein